eukprot:gene19890-28159_t
MSDFESLVKLFESRGFTGKEAIEKAEAKEARDVKSTVELERIKLEQIKQSGMNAAPVKVGNIFDEKFDIFGHGIGLAQLAVGVIGLGTLVAGGGLYAVKHHQRATSKFFNSLLATSEDELSKIRYSVLPRGQMTVGIEKVPIKRLNLREAFKSVALVGDNRSGKTIFLANTILNDMFPWWYRYVFPPRGLFLTGSQE